MGLERYLGLNREPKQTKKDTDTKDASTAEEISKKIDPDSDDFDIDLYSQKLREGFNRTRKHNARDGFVFDLESRLINDEVTELISKACQRHEKYKHHKEVTKNLEQEQKLLQKFEELKQRGLKLEIPVNSNTRKRTQEEFYYMDGKCYVVIRCKKEKGKEEVYWTGSRGQQKSAVVSIYEDELWDDLIDGLEEKKDIFFINSIALGNTTELVKKIMRQIEEYDGRLPH